MSLNSDLLQLLSRHSMHKPLVNSIFLTPLRQVKGYPSCHATAAGGQDIREARKAAGLCCTRHPDQQYLSRGGCSGKCITQAPYMPAQPGQAPSHSTLLIKGNATHKHRGWKARKARKFFGEIVTSQFTLNGFVWAERSSLGLPGDASAFYVNPTHTWPIFCCSERIVTIYLIQTRQLLGYIWTS